MIGKVLLQELPIISPIGNWLFPKLPPPSMDYPYIDKVDDVFKCLITQEPINDPVSLHGFIFERHAINEWLRKTQKHPITRKYASTNHIALPPTEYTEAYKRYMNRLIAQNA